MIQEHCENDCIDATVLSPAQADFAQRTLKPIPAGCGAVKPIQTRREMRQSIPLGLMPQNQNLPNRFEVDKPDARQLQLRSWRLQLGFRCDNLGRKQAIVVVARMLAVLPHRFRQAH